MPSCICSTPNDERNQPRQILSGGQYFLRKLVPPQEKKNVPTAGDLKSSHRCTVDFRSLRTSVAVAVAVPRPCANVWRLYL